MKINTEPFSNWFGFTRRERRSTFVLLLIIVVILGIRYAFPNSRMILEDFTGTISAAGKSSDSLNNKNIISGRSLSINLNTGRKFNSHTSVREPVRQKVRIDINSCDSVALVRLPAIGPVLSARIIKYRRLLGGYDRIDQLKEVYGLTPETYEIIQDKVFADSTAITRININSAGYKELAHFPYFEKYEITAIMKYRELKGKITGINELINNKLITAEKANKVRPYLKYDQ
jgi:DNA uptake protein ComE-like DNA-binding protein